MDSFKKHIILNELNKFDIVKPIFTTDDVFNNITHIIIFFRHKGVVFHHYFSFLEGTVNNVPRYFEKELSHFKNSFIKKIDDIDNSIFLCDGAVSFEKWDMAYNRMYAFIDCYFEYVSDYEIEGNMICKKFISDWADIDQSRHKRYERGANLLSIFETALREDFDYNTQDVIGFDFMEDSYFDKF